MTQNRFLRDNKLDEMITEIRSIAEQIPSSYVPSIVISRSLDSLSQLYEKHKITLVHLEDAISNLRSDNPNTNDALDSVLVATLHVQQGLIAIHESMKNDVSELKEQIDNLKNSLGLEKEDEEE